MLEPYGSISPSSELVQFIRDIRNWRRHALIAGSARASSHGSHSSANRDHGYQIKAVTQSFPFPLQASSSALTGHRAIRSSPQTDVFKRRSPIAVPSPQKACRNSLSQTLDQSINNHVATPSPHRYTAQLEAAWCHSSEAARTPAAPTTAPARGDGLPASAGDGQLASAGDEVSLAQLQAQRRNAVHLSARDR